MDTKSAYWVRGLLYLSQGRMKEVSPPNIEGWTQVNKYSILQSQYKKGKRSLGQPRIVDN